MKTGDRGGIVMYCPCSKYGNREGGCNRPPEKKCEALFWDEEEARARGELNEHG